MAESRSRALLMLDFINEIVDPKGKFAGRGYAAFLEANGTLDRAQQLLLAARNAGMLVVHVRVGFSAGYTEHPAGSPLLGAAKQYAALQLGTWATEFHPKVAPLPDEVIITKHRVNAFYGTPLDLILRNAGIGELLVCGVATDLAVQTAARDAHDRDYGVTVVADCCGAESLEHHNHTLELLSKVAAVKPLSELGLQLK
jgi:nicotinamidase-related amidase